MEASMAIEAKPLINKQTKARLAIKQLVNKMLTKPTQRQKNYLAEALKTHKGRS